MRVRGAFRREACSARRKADWQRPPPEPRSARYPAARPARRPMWMPSSRSTRVLDFRRPVTARRLGGRRRASRSGRPAAGVPGAPGWRAGHAIGRKARPTSPCRYQPESCAPAGNNLSRMTPAATAAKSRHADGRPGAGEDPTDQAQARTPTDLSQETTRPTSRRRGPLRPGASEEPADQAQARTQVTLTAPATPGLLTSAGRRRGGFR